MSVEQFCTVCPCYVGAEKGTMSDDEVDWRIDKNDLSLSCLFAATLKINSELRSANRLQLLPESFICQAEPGNISMVELLGWSFERFTLTKLNSNVCKTENFWMRLKQIYDSVAEYCFFPALLRVLECRMTSWNHPSMSLITRYVDAS